MKKQFKYRDKVIVQTKTLEHNGKCGEIIKFMPSAFGDYYNYVVEFFDGTNDVFINEEVKPLISRVK